MSDIDFSEFDSVDGADTVRNMLAAAINVGAPVYNAGDPRGCYDVYSAVARMLVRIFDSSVHGVDLLSAALQSAAIENDADEQAWILRRVFDEILGVEAEEDSAVADPEIN